MNLKDYLSKKGKAQKGKTKDWLSFCTLDVTTGSLWAGDPRLPNAEDGCVVKVPRGRYVIEGIGLALRRDRLVSRLRVRLQSAKKPKLGKEVGTAGTDSAMIGVCDIKAFNKAIGSDSEEEVQEVIEAQTGDGFGIITIRKFPGTAMPFVPTGSDGIGPVIALMSGQKCVGIELPFMDEEQEGSAQEIEAVSLMGTDRDDFITRRTADGEEVSFWLGGELKAGVKFSLWSSASRGPVDYRIRQASASASNDWSRMKKITGGDPKFRAFATLKPGKYEFTFRIGEEVFSPLTLTLA